MKTNLNSPSFKMFGFRNWIVKFDCFSIEVKETNESNAKNAAYIQAIEDNIPFPNDWNKVTVTPN